MHDVLGVSMVGYRFVWMLVHVFCFVFVSGVRLSATRIGFDFLHTTNRNRVWFRIARLRTDTVGVCSGINTYVAWTR